MGARNIRRLCALYYGKTSGFEIVHGLVDRFMQLVGIPYAKDASGYHIRAHQGMFEFYFAARDLSTNMIFLL